ncbi:MAG: chemotaxis protein CheW [Chroococcus sp. CMT-3BRIN-NPC107]|jgi:positive phototaxis protein PixI|nr:chemotaxis protein CheW [Chroococcus sp. CMT-3BRIN-NPC107]
MTPTPGSNSLDIAISATQTNRKKFLHFNLSKEVAALVKVEDITEVLHISGSQILPIPQMPEWVLGIHNWRDEMLWTIALDNFLLGIPLKSTDRFSTSKMPLIVVAIDNQYLGLVVAQVNDIEWQDIDSIGPPRAQLLPTKLLPFMQGYTTDSGTILLDTRAIAHSPLFGQFNYQLNL